MRNRALISVLLAAGLAFGIGGLAWSGDVTASSGEPAGWTTYTLDDTEPPGEPQVGGASVIGQDDRTRIYDSKAHPYRNTAFLISTFGQGYIISCTGTLIDHNVLVTAAHCLFDPQRSLPAMSVQVRPGQDGDVLPYGVAYATKFSVSTGFVPGSLPGTPQDFALVHLEASRSRRSSAHSSHCTRPRTPS